MIVRGRGNREVTAKGEGHVELIARSQMGQCAYSGASALTTHNVSLPEPWPEMNGGNADPIACPLRGRQRTYQSSSCEQAKTGGPSRTASLLRGLREGARDEYLICRPHALYTRRSSTWQNSASPPYVHFRPNGPPAFSPRPYLRLYTLVGAAEQCFSA